MWDVFHRHNLKEKSKIIIFILSGCIMVGHGLRMIVQGIFMRGSSYFPNTFDLIFDWLTLAVLGLILFWLGFYRFYIYVSQIHKLRTQSNQIDRIYNQPT